MGMLYEYDSIEQDIINGAAKRMAEDIDRGILWELLVGCGWKRVTITELQDNMNRHLIVEWMRKNIKNPYHKYRNDFIFSDEKDAFQFILRWA